MDKNTKIAVVILGIAILISIIGPLAIAFAVGYLTATVVNSPAFDHQAWLERAQKGLRSLSRKRLD